MKRVSLIGMVTCLALALIWAAPLASQETAPKGISVQITGKNVNLVKTVCGNEARELDPAFGAINALVVKEATDEAGKTVEGLAGKTLHYLPVASASALISGEANADKTVTVKGILYQDVLVIAVKEFEIKAAATDDDWDSWDEMSVSSPSRQQVI